MSAKRDPVSSVMGDLVLTDNSQDDGYECALDVPGRSGGRMFYKLNEEPLADTMPQRVGQFLRNDMLHT